MRIIITEDQYKRIIKEDINNQYKILKTINRIGLLKTIETIGYDTFKKMIPVDIIDSDKKIELINYICNYEDDAIYFYDIMYHDIVISEESVEDGISIESIYSIENNYVNAKTTTYNEDGEIVAEPYERGYLIPTNKLENNIIDIIFESLVKYYFEISRENTDLMVESNSIKDKIIKTIDRIGVVRTIESIGINTFINNIPVNILDKKNKIDLINYIISDEEVTLYFYDLIRKDIKLTKNDSEDDDIEEIYGIRDNFVDARTYRYNDYGEMDIIYDRYLIPLINLEDEILNQICEILIDYYMKKIRLTENDLTNIVKRVINENTTVLEKILKTIDRIGVVKTIEFIGYKTFKKVLPDYNISKIDKIDILNSIPEIKEGVALYDLIYGDIEVESRETDEGEEIDYITYIEDGYVTISTYELLKDGEMSDDVINDYSMKLEELDNYIINILFIRIVNNYFK